MGFAAPGAWTSIDLALVGDLRVQELDGSATPPLPAKVSAVPPSAAPPTTCSPPPPLSERRSPAGAWLTRRAPPPEWAADRWRVALARVASGGRGRHAPGARQTQQDKAARPKGAVPVPASAASAAQEHGLLLTTRGSGGESGPVGAPRRLHSPSYCGLAPPPLLPRARWWSLGGARTPEVSRIAAGRTGISWAARLCNGLTAGRRRAREAMRSPEMCPARAAPVAALPCPRCARRMAAAILR
jgi:hypothetical protein